MALQKYIRVTGRCLLSLTIICFSVFFSKSQEQPPDQLLELVDSSVNIQELGQQKKLEKNEIPIGLFTYNKWVDLNENNLVERNEFFGLGKESFSKGEPISASLYDPNLKDGANLKLRIWDTSGNLIRTVKKQYTSIPIFTYSEFDGYLPVGEYIFTINPEESGTTYQIRFTLKEPNGNTYATIRKKLLPENMYLFKQWIDEDGDMKLDSSEVLALNKNIYNVGEVDFELGLNLPLNPVPVVFQVWNSDYDLLSMNISKLDSLQHYTMNEDTLNRGNEFLRVLANASVGEYFITASVTFEGVKQYKTTLQIVDSLNKDTSELETKNESITKVDSTEGVDENIELIVTEEEEPSEAKMKMGTSVNVDNLAPEFKKGQEGFFIFSGFIDLNENNIQDRDEFIGADQDYFYSESENVFVQFHLRQFFNKDLVLQIFNDKDELVIEQIGVYGESPFVFKVSMPDEPLLPGKYSLIMKPTDSEIKYRLDLIIK